jgi:two-component system, OmpR family, sensor histidine kinase KdpD
MRLPPRAWVVRLAAIAFLALATATLTVGLLEAELGVENASTVYLAAVVVVAYVAGTIGAIVAAVASFLLYNFFFTHPTFTFTIDDPNDWLSVILLLFVGVVVGQLVAVQRSRTEIAVAREREARALFQVSRLLATRATTHGVLADIVAVLRPETGMERVWVALGADDARERVVADTEQDQVPVQPGTHSVLRRMPSDEPARWMRIHQPAGHRRRLRPGLDTYRVRIEAGGATLGSIWARRSRALGEPDRTASRLLAAAADQVGQALAQDRLADEARAAEVARQSDALKSALLQSVSHDLRTPLATIRAAVGTLRPGVPIGVDDQRASADAIDREVEYLNRLVTNLLDLSRIEAGALRAEKDVFELDDLVGRTIDRLRPRLRDRPVEISLDAPPVVVDPIFLDESVTNVVENALKYSPPGSALRIAAVPLPDEAFVRLTIEDGGPGAPDDALPRLFEKFYRVPGSGAGSRSGTGIGLAVVRGLLEAMGGRAAVRPSALGGLAVDLDLPMAPVPSQVVGAGP